MTLHLIAGHSSVLMIFPVDGLNHCISPSLFVDIVKVNVVGVNGLE